MICMLYPTKAPGCCIWVSIRQYSNSERSSKYYGLHLLGGKMEISLNMTFSPHFLGRMMSMLLRLVYSQMELPSSTIFILNLCQLGIVLWVLCSLVVGLGLLHSLGFFGWLLVSSFSLWNYIYIAILVILACSCLIPFLWSFFFKINVAIMFDPFFIFFF